MTNIGGSMAKKTQLPPRVILFRMCHHRFGGLLVVYYCLRGTSNIGSFKLVHSNLYLFNSHMLLSIVTRGECPPRGTLGVLQVGAGSGLNWFLPNRPTQIVTQMHKAYQKMLSIF